MINKLLNIVLAGIGIAFVFVFISTYIHHVQEIKQCRKTIDLQERIFENILEGQKLVAVYKPRLTEFFSSYYDSIVAKCHNDDKIILRVSENSCHSCIESIVSIIADKFDFKDFVVVTSYRNEHIANQVKILKQFPFRMNWPELGDKLGDRDINFIYCFKMNAGRRVGNIFIPIKEVPEYNSNYFEIMLSE